ncbi:hypothetical protein LPJ70_005985, partial [Coemansia sp. RSA 2708]
RLRSQKPKEDDEVSIADSATLVPSSVDAATTNNRKPENNHGRISRLGGLYNNNESIRIHLSEIDPTAGVYY